MYFQAELFHAPTMKKEATEKLHMPKFLEREVISLISSNYLALFLKEFEKNGRTF